MYERHNVVLRNMRDYAWTRENAKGEQYPVAEKKPNYLGLFDIYGNVDQLVRAYIPHYLDGRPIIQVEGGWEIGKHFVAKGGNYLSYSVDMRRAARREHLDSRYHDGGIRTVRERKGATK